MFTLRDWQRTHVPEELLIVQASTVDGRDGITAPPIGMGFPYVYQKGNALACQIGNHSKTVLCAIGDRTDGRRRPNSTVNRMKIIETLEHNDIKNVWTEPSEYFTTLPDYKFVISPEGNGIDTHRHYEALMAGCIPIIEDSPLMRVKYENVPVLWTYDYSEVNEEYLQEKYREMLDKTWDFSSLFINNWSICEQLIIRERSNYWCMRLTGKQWYDML